MSVVVLNPENFSGEVLDTDKPVVVDFYAEWCGPCKMVGPVIETLSEEYGEEVKFAKLDIDQGQSLAAQYGVASVPTLILFKGGEKVDQLVGAHPKGRIKDFVDKSK
ncbi:thioredoxin [PVC group bacterium (ex Bugula neritina AB1)]|nr:thioredoxin [PVC group bacterium (ex Bugula neritina AB1)]